MPMYGIGILPMIRRLHHTVRQLWYADDSAAEGKLAKLKERWDKLITIEPDYGYFPNASKTKLLVKPENVSEAQRIFMGSGIRIITEGNEYLGCPIGSEAFIDSYVSRQTNSWVQDLEKLAAIAETQPHCVYAALPHSCIPSWNYMTTVVD